MVRIRMQRLGRTHRPFYRIAAAEKRVKRDGKVLENLGWYNPIEKDPEKQLSLKAERIQYWLSVGAQPSDTVMDILGKQDLLTPKLKDAWLAKREADRNRVGCKVAVSTAEKALAEVGGLNAEGADLAGFTAAINEALTEAKAAVSAADPKAADAARAKADSALSDARSAVEKAQAQKKAAEEAEARKKAEEEAAAAAATAEAPAEEAPAEEDKPAEG